MDAHDARCRETRRDLVMSIGLALGGKEKDIADVLNCGEKPKARKVRILPGQEKHFEESRQRARVAEFERWKKEREEWREPSPS